MMLKDCEGILPWTDGSVRGNVVTRGTSNSIHNPTNWTPESVYRYYGHKEHPRRLSALNVAFFTTEFQQIDEPLITAGELLYDKGTECPYDDWDLWHCYFEHAASTELPLSKVLTVGPIPDRRIESARIVTVPLMSIGAIEDVVSLFTELSTVGTR